MKKKTRFSIRFLYSTDPNRSCFLLNRRPLRCFRPLSRRDCQGAGNTTKSTSRYRPLTPEELQKLAEGIKPLVNRLTEGLVQVRHADGSVSMDLQGRFQNVAVAKKEADGTIKTSCVDNLASFAAFFGD